MMRFPVEYKIMNKEDSVCLAVTRDAVHFIKKTWPDIIVISISQLNN